jgi:flagellar hook-associated protein 3 FlgL
MITGDYSTLGLLIADNASVKTQLDQLTEQISTGFVADSYGGLGASAQTALDLGPQLNTLTEQQTAIGAVSGQLGVTQTALSQIASIASTFAADTVNLNGIDPASVDSTAASATLALQQLAGILDTNDGDDFVFAGTDSANPPVPDPQDITSSGFYTQINAAVSSLSSTTDNSASIIASTLATAQSNAVGTTPFSATIGGPTTLELSGGQLVQTGLVANANTLATSTGTSTTGSYIRDLLRGLATLSSLSSSQVNDPGFGALVSDTRTSLQGAVSALATETGALGNIQSGLTTQATQDGDTATSLQTQLGSVEDVDLPTALTQLSAVQTQLQASYQVIAGAKNLSLVQYL